MALANRLNSLALVRKFLRFYDGLGGYVKTPSTVDASMACRISAKSNKERDIGNQIKALGNYVGFVLYTTVLEPGMTMTVDGMVYEILEIKRPSRGSHLELMLENLEDRD